MMHGSGYKIDDKRYVSCEKLVSIIVPVYNCEKYIENV